MKIATEVLMPGLALALLLHSCALTPPPDPEIEMPEQYRQPTGDSDLNGNWWTSFGDEQLDSLMVTTLRGNLTLEQAAARLRQAEAVAVQAGADRFPRLTGTAQAGTSSTGSNNSSTITTGSTRSTNYYSLGLVASYELDLWGRVASTRQAALSALEASRFDLQASAMTIAAETVDAYFEWQLLNARLALLNEQLENRRLMLSVVDVRFKASLANALDVLNQREAVAAAEALIPPVRDSLQAARNRLAILTGRPPQADLGLEVQALPELPERPAAGLPSQLLAMRPDLRSAWAELEKAEWNVRAAQASRLPTLTLSGSLTTIGESIDSLFDSAYAHAHGGRTPEIKGWRSDGQARYGLLPAAPRPVPWTRLQL